MCVYCFGEHDKNIVESNIKDLAEYLKSNFIVTTNTFNLCSDD